MDTAIFEIKLRINSNIASTANFTSTRTSWTVICLCSLNSLGKHTGVDCHSLLQGIFPTQGSNLGLLHCKQFLYQLSLQEHTVGLNYFRNVWEKIKSKTFFKK